MKKYNPDLVKEDNYLAFIHRIRNYTIVMIYNFLIYLCYSAANIISTSNEHKNIITIMYGIADILFCTISPLFIIVFLFNRAKWNDLKNILMCSQKNQQEDEIYIEIEYEDAIYN